MSVRKENVVAAHAQAFLAGPEHPQSRQQRQTEKQLADHPA